MERLVARGGVAVDERPLDYSGACRSSDDHATCDTAPGQGDGSCDACPITGGVTTEKEMFILLGWFYRTDP